MPVKHGLRRLALSHLARVKVTLPRAIQPNDDTGLHDFRVALRRLRNVIRLYRPWLSESVTRKQERQLRGIARASNKSRDLQVLAEKLRALDDLSENEKDAIELVCAGFGRRQEKALRTFRQAASVAIPKLASRIEMGLSRYTAALEPGPADAEPTGNVAARIAAELATELRTLIASIDNPEQQDEVHQTRISAKRLRDLLDAFAGDEPMCALAARDLKGVQDRLGALHDLHVLTLEVEARLADVGGKDRDKLLALFSRMRADRDRAFVSAQRDLFAHQAALVLDIAHKAAQSLMRGSDIEIGRKFLLKRMPRLSNVRPLKIMQGYLPGKRITERVRSVESEDGKTYYRAFKAGSGLQRVEIEEPIDARLFDQLWQLTKGKRIRKLRYVVEHDGHKWEIDRYRSRRLVLAEVELRSPREIAHFPEWLRSVVEREVTDEDGFTNFQLAH